MKSQINVQRILIVDPSLKDFIGHHAQYDLSVLDGARDRGIDGVAICHVEANHAIAAQVSTIPAFSEDMWGNDFVPRLSLKEIQLFVLGLASCIIFPSLARRRVRQLLNWIHGVAKVRRRIQGHSDSVRHPIMTFIAFVFFNAAPSGVYWIRHFWARLPTHRAVRALLIPPFFPAASKALPRLIAACLRVLRFLFPPILFRPIPLRRAVEFFFKLIFGIFRALVPRFVGIILKGMLQWLNVVNVVGRIPVTFAVFAMMSPRHYLEAKSGLRAANLRRGDLVFFHMVIGRNILETAKLCQDIVSITGISPVVLLRYPATFLASTATNLPIKLALRCLESLFERGEVRLASDSARLIREYSAVTYVPIELMPIPHGGMQSSRRKIEGTLESNACDFTRVAVASLGNARGEKGFGEIVGAMDYLAAHAPNARVRFILQINNPDADACPFVEGVKKRHYPFPVQFIQEPLGKQEYERLVESANVILAPYWREIYASRTSGVALEAITAGKILITTDDTWMSDEARRWKSGISVRNRDSQSIFQAILTALRDFQKFSECARVGAVAAQHFHSREGFVDHLTRQVVTRLSAKRQIAFCYPWPDLFEFRSGASVRSTLLVRLLVERGWKVRVVGSEPPTGTKVPPEVDFSVADHSGASFNNPLYIADFLFRLLHAGSEIGLEDFQYRFRFWHRSRTAKLALNSVLLESSAVILEYEFLAELVKPYAMAYQIPMVVDAHDVLAKQALNPRLEKSILKAEARALNLSNFSCCISEEDRAEFNKHGANPIVIENSIDTENCRLLTASGAQACLANEGIEVPSGPFGLFVGTAHPPNFIACKRLAEISKDPQLEAAGVHLVTAGKCYRNDLASGYSHFKQFGFVSLEALRALYTLAKFVIVPLEFGTGSSVKTMEALAYGKAVIGTSVAFRGIEVSSGIDAILVGKIDDFPKAILELLADQNALEVLERNAKMFASRRDFRRTYRPVVDFLDKYCQAQSIPVCDYASRFLEAEPKSL